MGLNIKNERVHELAREAARRTGKSQTGAIEDALERLLESLGPGPDRDERRQARVDVFLSDVDVVVSDEMRAAVHAAQQGLYDDAGMPA